MITNNTNTHKPYKHLSKALLANGYATRIIGGVQDRDSLIEQSPNHSNRTFSVSIKVGSVMEFFQIFLCL